MIFAKKRSGTNWRERKRKIVLCKRCNASFFVTVQNVQTGSDSKLQAASAVTQLDCMRSTKSSQGVCACENLLDQQLVKQFGQCSTQIEPFKGRKRKQSVLTQKASICKGSPGIPSEQLDGSDSHLPVTEPLGNAAFVAQVNAF